VSGWRYTARGALRTLAITIGALVFGGLYYWAVVLRAWPWILEHVG